MRVLPNTPRKGEIGTSVFDMELTDKPLKDISHIPRRTPGC